MTGRVLRFLLLCAVLFALGAQVFGQEVAQPTEPAGPAIKLEYKFKAGELLRYKLDMTMDMIMQTDVAGAPAMPPASGKMTGILRQRTKRVLPNGDAEMVAAIESMTMDMMGQSTDLPVEKMPTINFIMTKTGVTKVIGDKSDQESPFSAVPFGDIANMSRYGYFPADPVRAGDSWKQEVPFPFGSGAFQVESKLLRTDAEMGGVSAAVVRQNVTGDMDLGSVMSAMPSAGAGLGGKSEFSMNSVIHFSPEQGRMLRTEGLGTVRMDMSFSGGAGDNGAPTSGQIRMSIQMKYEISLLPEKGN